MHILYVGGILGGLIYISWFGYYIIYMPRKLKDWFEASLNRLLIVDLCLTVVSMIALSSLSDSLTAVVASSVVGFLATITTIVLRGYQKVRSMIRKTEPI